MSEWIDDDLVPRNYRGGRRWYCVYCHPQKEFRAERGLQAIGYRTFLPTERKWIRHARYKTEKIVPLLSRYLFVNFDVANGWPGLAQVDGVASLLCNDGLPVRIDEEIITALMQSCRFGVFDETTAVGRLPIGAAVKIMVGPLRGFIAELKSADSGAKRAEIFVSMLGKKMPLRMKFAELRAV